MVDPQRIHPAGDVEAPPTLPRAPVHGPSSSTAEQEKGNKKEKDDEEKSQLLQHIRSAPLQLHGGGVRSIPVINASPLEKRNSSSSWTCCRCMCWTVGILLLVLILLGATTGILYLIFQPKLPNYSVDSLKISDLRLNLDMSLYAKFDLKITAMNPNKKIGIYYEQGGRLSVWYTNMRLCQGTLPSFYQGHQNKTLLDVALTGQTQYGNTLMNALQQQQQTGRIPLNLKVDAPVAIQLGKLKLRKVRILGQCLLVVDSLTTNNFISIKADNCRFKLKL